MTLVLKKGEKIVEAGGRTLQVTEVTPVGDTYIVVQFYIEGSRKQVDITNPNPVLDTNTSRMVPPEQVQGAPAPGQPDPAFAGKPRK